MDKMQYIFCKPEIIDDIKLYPIKMHEYDDFMKYANILTLSYENFEMDKVYELYPDTEFKLLDLILLFYVHPDQRNELIRILTEVFSYVTHKEIIFDPELAIFIVDGKDGLFIDRNNYDEIRKVILSQNLIFTPPIYKNKLVQEWVDLALKARAQSSLKITNEAMITTISAFNGMDINLLTNYSYYQVSALFQRILKFKGFDTSILFRSVGGEVPIDHFAEEIDLLKNPYDSLIKDDSGNKEIEKIISGKF